MRQRWNILYRGSLSSCNYACGYCPFAKTKNTREELEQDQRELQRFVGWLVQLDRPVGVLFTPWGESIIHRYYRQAMIRLSHSKNVQRVAVQTNLSCRLGELEQANNDKLALWATFHPTEVSQEDFVTRCKELDELSIRYSVGIVGLREHFQAITNLRGELRQDVYLWINAHKRDPDYYSVDEKEFLRSIDPYFDLNRQYYASKGKSCHAGARTFTVDGHGDVRRCHFIKDRLGNIFSDNLETLLTPQVCTNDSCGCHIGYVHRPELGLYHLFGDNVLERIPCEWPIIDQRFVRNPSTTVRPLDNNAALSDVIIIRFKHELARETVTMWRASKEKAIGVKDFHPFDDHVDFLCNRLAKENDVYLAIHQPTNSVVGIMAIDGTKLNQLYVHTDFQRVGIGTRLLEIAKQSSKGKLRLFTFQVNTGAQAFYEKHGFIVIGRDYENEEGLPDLQYEWTANE